MSNAALSSPLLSIQNIDVYLGGHPILQDLSLESGSGILGIVGSNGTGKSTLLRTIAGIIRPLRGEISIVGSSLSTDPVHAKRHIGYLPEHADLYPHLSCTELCEMASILRKGTQEDWKKYVEPLGLKGLEHVRIGLLSAGQQRKVTLLVALCGQPTLLLLDEPTKALDQEARAVLEDILSIWKKKHRLVLLTSHLATYLQHHCTHLFDLNQGQIKAL